MPKWQHSCDHPCTDRGKARACDSLFTGPKTSQPKSGCLGAHLLSVPVLVGLLLDHLCTAALPEKKNSALHLLNKVGRKKKKKKQPTQIFKVSTQRMQSSEHKTAGGAGFVLPLPVAYGKQENSAPFALCTIPVHPPDHRRVTSIQAFRRERKRVLV